MSIPNTHPVPRHQGASAGFLRFQKLWEDAILKYNNVTDSNLRRSPLFNKMIYANSVEEVVRVLEEHKKGFRAFRKHGEKARAVVAPIFTFTKLLIDAGGEAAVASGVVPGGKAIFTAFGVLLEAAEKVSQSFDAIEGLLSRLGGVLRRLHNHLRSYTVLNDQLEDIFVRALVQLLDVLALCTKYIRKRVSLRDTILKRTGDYSRALLGNKDVKDALEKLDKLTKEELLANTAQTLDVVQGIANGVDAVCNDLADLRGIGASTLNLHREDCISGVFNLA
ncbi:uncharacterized protein PHACADRAFT_202741 [Phanerochaete carnosa HHB-10118-sp]|uniref:Fungal STAND N-terminal Goodbye domain-containing protein n=1 Tax=Phanerochaete carnosa (strain HHB-10118-sp) TaxID=650164 RepID=K5UG96_PHACS|nr:uncharacterized protein PHACADRAFT_202741 [Phanerochaete carnosa HHB-10118-sp]EKM48496.1 hypothetical protein PHACADRAFT_202741 [Phanerochaete carnosa HHB-10118-sp]